MRWARAVLSAFVGLGAVAFSPIPVDGVAEAPPSGLRVMTWNVLGSAGPDPGALGAEIVRRGVDVAGLQEIERAQTLALERYLRAIDPRWRAVWHATGHDPGGGLPFTPPMEGHAILSRYPLSRVRSRSLPRRDFHERILQRAVVTVGDEDVYVYNTHLCRTPAVAFLDRACWARDQAGRTEQTRAILRHMRRDGAAPSILLGDLNARPGSRPIELLGGRMRDAQATAASRTRIDYVFVSGLFVESSATPRSELSDHDPVVAELSLDAR